MNLVPIDALTREFLQAGRSLARSPRFAIIAVLTLGLACSAATAVYAVLKQVVLDGLPYPDAERLMVLRTAMPKVGDFEWQFSKEQLLYLRDKAPSLESVDVYATVPMQVETPEGVQRMAVTVATAGMHRLLGAKASLGRTLRAADEQPDAPPVVFLTHGFWQRHFGGDPSVLGDVLRIDLGTYREPLNMGDEYFEIVGILDPGPPPPEGFADSAERPDIWMAHGPLPDSTGHSWPAIAKRRPGVDHEQVQIELDSLMPGLADAFPDTYDESGLERSGYRTRATPLKSHVVGSFAANLWLAQAAAGLLLVVAWVNTAGLFLVRGEARNREVAVRAALGAGRGATFRLFLAECCLITLTAGALGLLGGYWSIQWLALASPNPIPRLVDQAFEGGVLGFALALSALAAIVIAGALTVRFRRMDTLAEAGRRSTPNANLRRVQAGLVIAQVAMATALIAAAGLLLSTFATLRNTDPGFRPDGVVRVAVTTHRDLFEPWWPSIREITRAIEEIPGVSVAGAASGLPLTGFYGHDPCPGQLFEAAHYKPDDKGGKRCIMQIVVSPGYFDALGIPLVLGRAFETGDLDEATTGAAVVSQAVAEAVWPGENPLGKGIAPPRSPAGTWYRIVGVVGDVQAYSVRDEPVLAVYYPLAPVPGTSGGYHVDLDIVVRTGFDDPTVLIGDIRRAVENVDSTLFVDNGEAVTAIVHRSMGQVAFVLVLLTAASGGALVLAVVGIYATVAWTTARRTNEIGVRMALGARRGRLQRMVVVGAMKPVVVGLAIGIPAGMTGAQAVRSLLFGVTPTSPLVHGLAVAALLAAACGASWLAARRATRISPMDALRLE